MAVWNGPPHLQMKNSPIKKTDSAKSEPEKIEKKPEENVQNTELETGSPVWKNSLHFYWPHSLVHLH